MIITRTPFRVSFVGGGSDARWYFQSHGRGAVLSVAIAHYMYIVIHPYFHEKKGLLAICVTNQPGLAKGFFDFATLADVHRRLDVMLAQEGAYLDDIYVCPHHPERGFEGEVATLKIDCECRKPQPGLLKQAAEFHNIDLVSSCIIGDRVIDIAAGAAVGAKGYLVNNRDPADAMAVEALQGTVVDGGLQAALQAIFEPHDQTGGSVAC